jgi:choloylglycine hydrolase
MLGRKTLFASIAAVVLLAAPISSASACTGIRVRPQDGSVISARTLEFGTDLHSMLIVVPRNLQYVGTAPGGKPGLKWSTRFGIVGTNALGLPHICDGLNEKGLGMGLFYFPEYAGYQPATVETADKTLAPWELTTYLLGACGTVDEAIHAAREVRVVSVALAQFGSECPPVHYVLHDATGRCAVLEYVGGELHVYDNPLGVFTNAPTFEWHLTNLRNYLNLLVDSAPPADFNGLRLTPFGQGDGMHGLPGDFTPPSRFVRAVAFTQSAVPVATAPDGVRQAFHLLNQFDIPKGLNREKQQGQTTIEYTSWTSASDLTNRRFYFHTYDDRQVRMVDLKGADLDSGKIVTVPMTGATTFDDVTPRLSQAKAGTADAPTAARQSAKE